MAIYRYRAKKDPQNVVEGTLIAQSEKEAIEKLVGMGYVPVRVEQEVSVASSPASLGKTPGKIRSRQITIFSRQLASLLKSGVPILNSLSIICEQSEQAYLKYILHNIYNAVKDGATFSGSLAKFPNVFSALYIALVRSGEDSGALPEALLRIADYRAKQEELFSRFRMALAYPILMAIVGLATVVFMLTFVMPRLMGIFTTLGQSLPLPTRILISVSKILRQWWIWVVLILLILIIRKRTKSEKIRSSVSLFKLHLPLFGRLVLKAELSRFCRTLEILIKNGIPILKALEIAIPVVDSQVIKNQLKQSHKELEEGGSFGRSFKNSKLFPPFMSNLIIVGEESGKLHDALAEVASSYEHDTDEAIKITTNLLEPLMILIMGLIVGFIVVAMLLPIFEINIMAR